jgi:hypothetical protein
VEQTAAMLDVVIEAEERRLRHSRHRIRRRGGVSFLAWCFRTRRGVSCPRATATRASL